MEMKRICALYWSATGNTKQVTMAVAKGAAEIFACPMETVDFSSPKGREAARKFDADTLLVAGFPTYAGKLPNKILPDVQQKLKGNGALAAAVVTYGNRSFDNSLAELAFTLGENGFTVAGGAALPCRHAFSDLLAPGRPDQEDLKQATQFGRDLAEKIQRGEAEEPVQVPGDAAAPYYVPKGTDGAPAKFLKAKPLTDPEKCNHCGDCVKLCPVGSISAENVFEVPGVCIKCQACVRGCKQGAKYFDDAAFLSHVAMLEQNFTERKEAEYFL